MDVLLFQKNSRASIVVWAAVLQLVVFCTVIALTLSCTKPVTNVSSTNRRVAQSTDPAQRATSINHEPASRCRICHAYIYQQFSESMHAKSFANPLFRAEFFNILLPRAENSVDLSGEVRACIACHSPVTSLQAGQNISSERDFNQTISNVECDLCHTISGYTGPRPGNGNYISKPNEQKSGPLSKNDFHGVYSELHTKSEFCATCHNRTNRYGLEIISTYSEWQESEYANKGIECQDCHMNVHGFLKADEPEYEAGEVAHGTFIKSKRRDKIYTHRFPGAHSDSQVKGAIQLDIQVDESVVEPGKEIIVLVHVDNSRTGHKFSSGSVELRLLYLELVAEVGGKSIPLFATSKDKDKFDISGRGKFDSTILGNDIPAGRRVYRAICIDEEGQQTLFSFDAVKIAFDNRLLASEIRRELFFFKVPDDVGPEFSLVARLNYLRYPSSFADELGVPNAKLIEIANARKEIVLYREPEIIAESMPDTIYLFGMVK